MARAKESRSHSKLVIVTVSDCSFELLVYIIDELVREEILSFLIPPSPSKRIS